MRRSGIPLFAAVLFLGCTTLSTQDRGTGKERPEALPGADAPDFSRYRTPIDARVVDPRFRTAEAMYLSNEMQIGSFYFFETALADGIVQSDTEFQYMTTVESYWYSRYNMSALTTESRLGIGVVFSPYVTEWALREGRANINRDRGEYVPSNKGVFLHDIIPMYMERSGFPRRFEDASPSMLQYASGDPHYIRPLDKGVMFESTENLLRNRDLARLYGDSAVARPFGMGAEGNEMWTTRINYRENFLTLRWNESDHAMEHEIDLGAEGQTLMKQVLWIEYFFRGSHHDGRYLGNDPEEGFRGSNLNLMAVSKMLMLKGSMAYDGRRLGGVDPREAVPGVQYFPHRYGVRLRTAGDLPPRPEEFRVVDGRSLLFDQASLLWGLTEYYHFADPSVADNWDRVFGENPPYDGSVMEQKYIVLAEGLADMVLANIAAMHMKDGRFVSEYKPGQGPGANVSTRDLAMTIVALANYARRMHDPEKVAFARRLLQEATVALLASRAPDGSVAEGFEGATPLRSGPPTLLSQAFAVRALLEAQSVLGEGRALDAAKGIYSFMNASLWDDHRGLYRSQVGADVTVYTPVNVGAALGAMREVILATHDAGEIERFKRFWVQGVNSSGIQQSEYEETGERDFTQADGDGDGIPRMEYGDGKYGIAPVYASRVEIATPTGAGPATRPSPATRSAGRATAPSGRRR